jgi:hypothetical protein
MELVRQLLRAYLSAVTIALGLSCVALAQTSPPDGNAQITRTLGTIKTAQADTLLLTPDAGGEVTAKLSNATKILRVPPGEKDLKNATPLLAQDLQPGDRVLVRGTASADGRTIVALSVVVMKQADVSAKQEREREDWQKRGAGGLVTAVDTAAGTITISSASAGRNHDIVIHTSQKPIARRYAPDSVKFDDAKPASVDQIKPGDQLRARGNRNADGSELTAEEIVFGRFRNIAGTISAIDAPSNTMTVNDLTAKKPVVVKVTADSQIKKLPAEMAARIAARLKGGNGNGDDGGQNGASGQQPSPRATNAPNENSQSARRSGGSQSQGAQEQRGGGPPDLQRSGTNTKQPRCRSEMEMQC